MLSRIRDALRIAGALAGAALILAIPILAAGPGGAGDAGGAGAPAAPRSDLEALLRPEAGAPRRDQAGQAVSAERLGGRTVVVSFLTTGCGIACVIRLRDLAALERSLPEGLRGRVAVLGLTLDPARDDRPALRAFAESLGLDPARFALVDSDPATAARQRALLRYPPERSEPPDTVLVFDRTGQLAMSYGANPVDRPRLARDLAEIDRFAQGVGHPPTAAAPAL